MKRITEAFTNEEHQQLATKKEQLDMNWHDFIMLLTKVKP